VSTFENPSIWRGILVTPIALVLAAGLLVSITPNIGSASTTKVASCTKANHVVMHRQYGTNGAGGQILFRVVITNDGAKECSVVIPSAQPVVGANRTLVGPPSRYSSSNGSRGPLTLMPRRSASLWYAVTFWRTFTREQCDPAFADGAVFGLKGVASLYFRVSPGATEVCLKKASTWVEDFNLIP
jgi:hypothetical protein